MRNNSYNILTKLAKRGKLDLETTVMRNWNLIVKALRKMQMSVLTENHIYGFLLLHQNLHLSRAIFPRIRMKPCIMLESYITLMTEECTSLTIAIILVSHITQVNKNVVIMHSKISSSLSTINFV